MRDESLYSSAIARIAAGLSLRFATPRHTHSRVARPLLLGLALATTTSACLESNRAIDWRDDDAESVQLPAESSEQQRLAVLNEALSAMPEADVPLGQTFPLPAIETPPAANLALGDGPFPADPMRCDNSLQLQNTTRGEMAVWWSNRGNGRVHLLGAWRDLGQSTWRGPIAVDTLDVGSTDARDVPEGVSVGCARPAPGLAVDGANGFVHVAYALVGPEGPGVFYAHQMDPRAAFEPPIPIVYGEKLGKVRVGSDGDLVAVVYEDPNSGKRQRIAVAVSRTAGHVFEGRLNVNAGLNPGSNPYVVARGSALVIGWHEAPPAGGDTTFLRRRAVAR